MKKHQKHSPLLRRKFENYGTSEIAVLGAKCSIIADLVKNIVNFDQKSLKIAYFDASHEAEVSTQNFDIYTRHQQGNLLEEKFAPANPYQDRIRFSAYDLLFINGNHFEGSHQIVILDPQKEASITKRIAQINSILCILITDENVTSFPCLEEKFPELATIPRYKLTDIKGVYKSISGLMSRRIPPLKGLILAGGKSERMGTDKTQLNYHGQPQIDHLIAVMKSLGIPPHISVAQAQASTEHRYIVDRFTDLGAYGGICSAFQQDPNAAWFVIAADVPFVDEALLQRVLNHRNSSKVATALKGKSKEFIEPLITIYEPKAYPKLLAFLAMGYACPRKMLINNEVEIVEVDDHFVTNVNTPEEYDKAIQKLKDNG